MNEQLRDIANAARKAESLAPREESRAVIESLPGRDVPTYGRVMDSAPIGYYKWAYVVQPVAWDGAAAFISSGSLLNGVRNLNEWFNSLGYCGNGVHAGNVPGNFEMQPANIGKPLVIVYMLSGLPFFIHTNGVDGVCS